MEQSGQYFLLEETQTTQRNTVHTHKPPVKEKDIFSNLIQYFIMYLYMLLISGSLREKDAFCVPHE